MLTGPITIRDATAEDIPFLQAMIWEAILASPTLLVQDGLETMQQYEEHYWKGWVEHPDPAFVALDATGCKLGAITIKPNDTGEPVRGWRIGIGVESYARGQGVGQHLLKQAIAFARVRVASYVNLFVDPTNIQAIALYQHLGFLEAGQVSGLIEMRINLEV
jgi:ribosomal protein S18 acetylase RimI-like enzyme